MRVCNMYLAKMGCQPLAAFACAAIIFVLLLMQYGAVESINLNENQSRFTQNEVVESLEYAKRYVQIHRLESTIANSRVKVNMSSASFGQLLESLPNALAQEQNRHAQLILRASVQLLNRYCLGTAGHNEQTCAKDVATVSIPESDVLRDCQQMHNVDGQLTAYRRLLPPNYGDGLQQMGHTHSKPLPKTISDLLYAASQSDVSTNANVKRNHEGVLDHSRNVGVVQWAQFIEHDLAQTVQQTMNNGVPIECCAEGYRAAAPRYRHPACAPLIVESQGHQISCLNYVRSALGVDKGCKFGPAQQLNQATNILDLSQLYGASDATTNELRRFSKGELRATEHSVDNNSTAFTLPQTHSSQAFCLDNTSNETCYLSGDSRLNIDPYVTPLYTMMLRMHNDIAKEVRAEHKTWHDGRVFRMARRINTALYQRIVFDEWAPVVLGRTYGEFVNAARNRSSYDESSVSNEYATAAARFYYSMMPGDLMLPEETLNTNIIRKENDGVDEPNVLELKNEFYRPRDLGKSDHLERIMSAILNQEAMAMDTEYVDDVSQYRFRYSEDQPFGTDVLALDIQRGRDHGLAGYSKYVEKFSRRRIAEWADLETLISAKNLNRLQSIYANVDQIDLIVGGISERVEPTASVGPTFASIIADQLANSKRASDRTATSTSPLLPHFTGAHLVCQTTNLESVPRNIFQTPSIANPPIDCNDLQRLRLNNVQK